MTDTLIQTVLGVTALLLLVLVSRRAVARHFGPRAAYALWLLPIARLFMPSIDLPRSWLPEMFQSAPEPVSVPLTNLPPELVLALTRTSAANPADTGPALSELIITLFILIWLAGLAVGLIWVVRAQYRQAQHVRRTSVPVSSSSSSDIVRAYRLSGLRHVPAIRMSHDQNGPLVFGLLRPTIVLPCDFESRFTPEQRRLALLHEMLHVRRGDLWAVTLMLGFRLLNWPNPLIHWAWPRFRADQEAACDASVLRRTGDISRGDYAETLLTAASSAGRASPVSGTGLTLSLNHPVKERVMTLESNRNTKHGITRWALGAVLLAGTALSAPLSLADDQSTPPDVPDRAEAPNAPVVVDRKIMRWVVSDDDTGEFKSFEVREKNGAKTYLRVDRDGNTEELSYQELVNEYGTDLEDVIVRKRSPSTVTIEGEPGLSAMLGADGDLPNVFTLKRGFGDKIKVETIDGKRRIYRIDEDGNKVELDLETVDEFPAIELQLAQRLRGSEDGRFRVFSDSEKFIWSDEDGDGPNAFAFAFGLGPDGEMAATQARMKSALAMIEATDRMVDDMRLEADGKADRDLRVAEKELDRARKALDKAMEAVRKSETR